MITIIINSASLKSLPSLPVQLKMKLFVIITNIFLITTPLKYKWWKNPVIHQWFTSVLVQSFSYSFHAFLTNLVRVSDTCSLPHWKFSYAWTNMGICNLRWLFSLQYFWDLNTIQYKKNNNKLKSSCKKSRQYLWGNYFIHNRNSSILEWNCELPHGSC